MNDPTERLKVAVIGLGSIGGIAAGALAVTQKFDLVACVRKPLEKLTYEWPGGVAELPLRALTDPALAAPADWVLLCTKTQDTASAAPWLKRLCGPGTHVAVLQNGIDHQARVAPLAGGAEVVPVIVYYNGERLAPDRVRLRQGANHDFAVAEGEAGRAFTALFADTPLRVHRDADFTTLAWRKLLINAIASPLTALTLQRQAVLRRPDIQALERDILSEVIAVARADGAKLSPDEADRALAALFTFPPDAGTSMYFDRLAGRALEVEAITGAVVATGEKYGIATPLNRALLAVLRAISEAATKSA
jgi:2-dehydropantoate 2-reductase